MKFGVWTPLPHIGYQSQAMKEAIAQLTEPNQQSFPSKAFEIVKETIQLAENLGFHATLVAERFLGHDLEAWILASSLAAITSKIELIVAVHPGLFPPQIAAKMGATLDQISRGRFHLNIVNGRKRTEEFDIFGGTWIEGDERYQRTEEFIQMLKGFWEKESFNLDGKFYRVSKNGNLPTKTVQKPYPPIYMASGADKGRELIARDCEVYFVTITPQEGYRNYQANLEVVAKDIRQMKERASRYGRSLEYALSAHVIIDDDQNQAEKWGDEIERLGQNDRIVNLSVKGLALGLVGSPQVIAERIKEYEKIGVNLFMLNFCHGNSALHKFAQTVMPIVKMAHQ